MFRGPNSLFLAAATAATALVVPGCSDDRMRDTAPVSQSRTCNEAGHVEVGTASWYGEPHHGRVTASGGIYDMNKLTAAHRRLPFGTRIRVTNLANGRAVVLTVTDRGPFVAGRVIDVSRKAAEALGFRDNGLARVRIAAASASTCL